MKNKPWHTMTVSEQIKARDEEGFERRMQMGVKELSHHVEQNPTAFDRVVTEGLFDRVLDELRRHYSPEEIRAMVEDKFKLPNFNEALSDVKTEVLIGIKNVLDEQQTFYINKVNDNLKEALADGFDEALEIALDSVELGYMSEDIYQDIVFTLEAVI